MLQIPHEFILLQGIPVPEKGKYGTGLLFLPKDGKDQAVILSVIIEEIEKEGLTLMHMLFTIDFYKRFKPKTSEKKLVVIGLLVNIPSETVV